MKDIPLLKTNRLILRPFIASDYPFVYQWCHSLEVTKYLFWHPALNEEASKKIVNSWVKKRRNYSWALEFDKVVFGEIEVIKDLADKGFEIGYTSLDTYWGQGYMSEALARVLGFLLYEKDYQYAYAESDERNERSLHLLKKFGFLPLGPSEPFYVAKKDETIPLLKLKATRESLIASLKSRNPGLSYKEALLKEVLSHPKLQVQDAIKMTYQASFGMEHLWDDEVAVKNYLTQEYEESVVSEEPLLVQLGGGYARLNLGAAKKEKIPAEIIFQIFKDSRGKKGDEWASNLKTLKEVMATGVLPFSSASLEAYLKRYTLSPVHHSKVYEETYKPHYRLVNYALAVNIVPLGFYQFNITDL